MPGQADGTFLRDAFECCPVAMAAIGLDGCIRGGNAAWAAAVGADVDGLAGVDATSIVHPDDLEAAIEAGMGRVDGKTVDGPPAPVRVRSGDGSLRWMQFDARLVDGETDDPYVLATMIDVSGQVEAEAALRRSAAWLETLVAHQSDIVTVVGSDGILRYISPNTERILGLCADELVGTSGADNVHPEDLPRLMDAFVTQLGSGSDALPVEYRQRSADGSWVWLEATVRALPAELGIDGVVVNSRDVRERRRIADVERTASERFRTAFASSPLGIGFAALDGRLMWVNHALSEIVGIAEPDLLTMHFQDFSTEQELAEELAETRRLLKGEIMSFRREKRYEHPDGRTVWAMLHASLVRDRDGAPYQLLGQLEDVTERKQLELALTHDASHDSLTGLLNRSALRRELELMWAVRIAERPMAVLFGDLDGFKDVNDTLGHDAGDEVLVHVAQRLERAVRGTDVVGRWGGDEFVILCPSLGGAADAQALADRVRRAVDVPFRITAGEVQVGIGIGVALDRGQPRPDLLVKDADAAAYRAKAQGRSSVEIASSHGSVSA